MADLDFASLLQQHTNTQAAAPTGLGPAGIANSLMGALSSSRDGGDSGLGRSVRGGRRRRGRGRGRHRGRYDGNRGPKPFSNFNQGAEDLGNSTYRFHATWGAYPLWKDIWQTSEPGNIVVTFEAKVEDNLVVAFSPEMQECDPMYEIVVGGWKNTKSIIRTVAQGPERAISTEARMCTSAEFRSYWARFRDGVVSVGIGKTVGDGLIIAWKDPSPINNVKFVSFTTWDNTATYRNIQVAKDENVQMEDIEFDSYLPGYLMTFEEERARARNRAERFGIEYVDPDVTRMAEDLLSPEERERVRKMRQSNRGGGFVTGFDPTTEEEKAKAAARAKRFGMPEPGSDEQDGMEGEEDYLSREKREQRAARFDMPVVQDVQEADKLAKVSKITRVPRKDPDPEDQKRPNAIHLYGPMDGLYTKDFMEFFGEYGPSHVEWLHDCALNVGFEDEITARRAFAGLSTPIPDISAAGEELPSAPVASDSADPAVGEDAAMEGVEGEGESADSNANPTALRSNGWARATVRGRTLLMRFATVTDIKVDVSTGYRTRIGYRGRGRRRHGAPRGQTHRKRRKFDDEELEDVSVNRESNADGEPAKRQRRTEADDDDL